MGGGVRNERVSVRIDTGATRFGKLTLCRSLKGDIGPTVESIKDGGSTAGGGVLGGGKIGKQNARRVDGVERSMSTAGAHECDTSFEKPVAVHVGVVEADENRGRIESQLCVPPGDAFERQGIVMSQALRHPGVSHGKATGVQLVLVCEGFEYRPIIERIACFHFVFEGVPFEIAFDNGQFSS